MDYDTLGYDLGDDGVALVTLDRPDRYNAFDQTMCDELQALWQSVRTDPAVRCVILTGAGDKAFCTGIDRSMIPADEESYFFDPFTYDDPGKLIGPKSQECWKPVVAAVNGIACGGAFYLLGESDVLLAAEHATFFDPHVTYGQPAVFEPTLMLAHMPFGELLRMTLLGNHERLSARRALEIGMVTEVAPVAELLERARWVASAIASAPPAAIQSTLRTIWAARELSRKQAIDLGNAFLNLGLSPELLEQGQAAFGSGTRIEPRTR